MIKRHVSAEEIARFGEGEVSRRKAARISSHLAGCSRCAQVRDDLAMVPALLARTEAPPMPDHLAARIQTALITESARRASPEAAAGLAASAAGAGLAAGPSGAARAGGPESTGGPGQRAAARASGPARRGLVLAPDPRPVRTGYRLGGRGGRGTGDRGRRQLPGRDRHRIRLRQ